MWQIISAYICGVIVTLEVVIFSRMVLGKKIQISKKQLVMLGIATSFLYAGSYLLLTGVLKTLFMLGIDILLIKYVYNIKYFKSVFLTFLYIVILILPDLLELFFMTQILGVSRDFCYNDYAGGLISNIIIFILFISITYLLRNILKKLVNEQLETRSNIICLSIFTSICILMFFYTVVKEFRFSNNVVVYLLAMMVLASALFSLIKQTIENNKLTREYDTLLEFMVTYENEIENQRTLRHEVKNEFRTIRAKLYDKQKNKEVIEYIDNIVNDKFEVKQEEYAKFGYLPPNGLKGLCYFKAQEAEEKGIKVALNISKRVKKSTIYHLSIKQQRDFGRILGVFLDNAIEASLESEKKQIGIEAYTNADQEFKMIISNTYNNEIDQNKIGKEAFSTKGKTRGHGLLLVKRLLNQSNIFEIKTKIQDNLYIQKIAIKKSVNDK